MHQENVRLETFKKWSYHKLDTHLLPNNGFFANNNGLPICYFCNFHLTRWTDWTDKVAIHRQNSPEFTILLCTDNNDDHFTVMLLHRRITARKMHNIIKVMLPADARSLLSNVIIMFEDDILTHQLLLHS